MTRSHKGVEPTAAGLALQRPAGRAIHALDEVQTTMLDLADGTRVQVRLFANISAIVQFLPADLARFAEEYPQIQLDLEGRNSAVTTKAVAENVADVGIFTAQAHGERVRTLPYERDELAVILRAGHSLASRQQLQLSEVLDWDFVGLRTGSATNGQLTEAATRTGRQLRLRVEVTGYDALCLMVSAGLGIEIAPRFLVHLFVREPGLCEVPLAETWGKEGVVHLRPATA